MDEHLTRVLSSEALIYQIKGTVRRGYVNCGERVRNKRFISEKTNLVCGRKSLHSRLRGQEKTLLFVYASSLKINLVSFIGL